MLPDLNVQRLICKSNTPTPHLVQMMYSGWAGLSSTQAADVHIHRARIALIVIAPHEVKQRLAAVHLAGVLHQKQDQVKLLHRELDLLAALHRAALGLVHGDVPAAYRAALFLGSGGRGGYRRSPQERPDARLEGKDVEGLCDIIIRAGLKAHEQVCVPLRAVSMIIGTVEKLRIS